MSTMQDNFVLIHVKNDHESLLEIPFKTEFLMVLNRKCLEMDKREIPRNFIDRFVVSFKCINFQIEADQIFHIFYRFI